MTLADAKVVDAQYMELEDCLDSGEWSGESGRAQRGVQVRYELTYSLTCAVSLLG